MRRRESKNEENYCVVKSTTSAHWKVEESSEFEEGNQENIQYWLECDVDDPDFQVLADDGIIASAIDDQDSCDDKVRSSDRDIVEKEPSTEEAFH
ncbi:hypothetical protein AVEN_124384-1 [Araneus ventricosus]|uniref:Uncharacterized protein n=1 Tax=Araneus ventricosus TaxID=182803 RepID=A0A4Y2R2B6_ARAVE|nr:hypothetical protein AVEN_195761-1 [Araneus ventricosus]GBN69741.1 hypothetical protein AVEN_124384-1 [Araneus ventricosus]